jgi:hypothetical protein
MGKFVTGSNWEQKSLLLEEKRIGFISTGVAEKRRAGSISQNRDIDCRQ